MHFDCSITPPFYKRTNPQLIPAPENERKLCRKYLSKELYAMREKLRSHSQGSLSHYITYTKKTTSLFPHYYYICKKEARLFPHDITYPQQNQL